MPVEVCNYSSNAHETKITKTHTFNKTSDVEVCKPKNIYESRSINSSNKIRKSHQVNQPKEYCDIYSTKEPCNLVYTENDLGRKVHLTAEDDYVVIRKSHGLVEEHPTQRKLEMPNREEHVLEKRVEISAQKLFTAQKVSLFDNHYKINEYDLSKDYLDDTSTNGSSLRMDYSKDAYEPSGSYSKYDIDKVLDSGHNNAVLVSQQTEYKPSTLKENSRYMSHSQAFTFAR